MGILFPGQYPNLKYLRAILIGAGFIKYNGGPPSILAYGERVIESITSGRNFNAISFANLVTALVVIQGPLLQRALSTGIVKVVHNVNILVTLEPFRI